MVMELIIIVMGADTREIEKKESSIKMGITHVKMGENIKGSSKRELDMAVGGRYSRMAVSILENESKIKFLGKESTPAKAG